MTLRLLMIIASVGFIVLSSVSATTWLLMTHGVKLGLTYGPAEALALSIVWAIMASVLALVAGISRRGWERHKRLSDG